MADGGLSLSYISSETSTRTTMVSISVKANMSRTLRRAKGIDARPDHEVEARIFMRCAWVRSGFLSSIYVHFPSIAGLQDLRTMILSKSTATPVPATEMQ